MDPLNDSRPHEVTADPLNGLTDEALMAIAKAYPNVRDFATVIALGWSPNASTTSLLTEAEVEAAARNHELRLEGIARAEERIRAKRAGDEALGWEPQDFEDVLNGTVNLPKPTVLCREDGPHLFYPAAVNGIHGESESGKTWVCICAAVQELRKGNTVVYVDYESSREVIVGRMLLAGATPDQLRAHFRYVRPEGRPSASGKSGELFAQLATTPASLIVLDGVTEALSQSGGGSRNEDDIAAWMAEVPKALADGTGAAVVLIDHVPKATGDAARFALGSQHKLAAITGVSYLIDVDVQPARGRVGRLLMKVAKDRHSAVREVSDPSAGGRLATTAELVIDSLDPAHIVFQVRPWDVSHSVAKAARVAMAEEEAVLVLYREAPEGFTSNAKVRAAYTEKHGRDIDSKKLRGIQADLVSAGRLWIDEEANPKVGVPSRLVA